MAELVAHGVGGGFSGALGTAHQLCSRGLRPCCQGSVKTAWGPSEPWAACTSVLSVLPAQTYCDRLLQDTPFLTGPGRLSEQQADRIILQLNRYYPQILSNEEAEKVFQGPHLPHCLHLPRDLVGGKNL